MYKELKKMFVIKLKIKDIMPKQAQGAKSTGQQTDTSTQPHYEFTQDLTGVIRSQGEKKKLSRQLEIRFATTNVNDEPWPQCIYL